MGLIENIGEAAISAFDKLASHLIGLLIKLLKFTRKIGFYPYFKERGIDFKDYVVLKAQMATLAFLFSTVLYVFGFLKAMVFALFFLVLGGYSLYIIPKLREFFTMDYNAYRDFFLGYLGIAMLLVLFKTAVPSFNPLFPNLHLVVLSIAYILVFSHFFKKKYGRSYTYGRVIEGGNPAKIKLNYDIRASVKPGIASLENLVNAGEGEMVKVEVMRSRFNLKGCKAIKILGVLDGVSTESTQP
jgi:uncharacterized membrane protein